MAAKKIKMGKEKARIVSNKMSNKLFTNHFRRQHPLRRLSGGKAIRISFKPRAFLMNGVVRWRLIRIRVRIHYSFSEFCSAQSLLSGMRKTTATTRWKPLPHSCSLLSPHSNTRNGNRIGLAASSERERESTANMAIDLRWGKLNLRVWESGMLCNIRSISFEQIFRWCASSNCIRMCGAKIHSQLFEL